MENKFRIYDAVTANPDLLIPFGNYIVVEVMKPEETTRAGLALPDATREKGTKMLAKVLKVGPGQRSITTGKHMPMQCAPGDWVIIMRHAPVDVVLYRDVICHVIAEGDILGKIDGERLGQILSEMPDEDENAEPADEVYDLGEVKATLKETESGLLVATTV